MIRLPPLDPLERAKRRAESFGLTAKPLETVDPKLAARIKRENSTPHPVGSPLNRQPTAGELVLGASATIPFKQSGPWLDDLAIPVFLRRNFAELREAA